MSSKRFRFILQAVAAGSIALGAAPALHAEDTCTGKVRIERVYGFKMGTQSEYTASIKNLTGNNVTVTIHWFNLPEGSSQRNGQFQKLITGRNSFEMPMGRGPADIATAGVKFVYNGASASGPYISVSNCH